MSGERTEWPPVKWGRRLLLAVLLGFGIWLVHHGLPQVCGQEVADSAVVSVCRPLPMTDPRVWFYGLLVGLLLFPELSELELAGVLTLRRRLNEVGQEASDLKSDLANLRLQATALSQANATNRTAVTVDARQQQSGVAQVEVATPGSDLVDDDTASGAYLQLAFKAGLAGLTAVLPAEADGADLVCYTFGDDGQLEPIYQSDPDADVDALTQTLNEGRDEASVTSGPRFTAATAYAQDPRGSGVVGAVVLLTAKPAAGPPAATDSGDDAGDDADGDGSTVDLAAAAETVAATYARLLVDLVGERPRGTVPGISAEGKAP